MLYTSVYLGHQLMTTRHFFFVIEPGMMKSVIAKGWFVWAASLSHYRQDREIGPIRLSIHTSGYTR